LYWFHECVQRMLKEKILQSQSSKIKAMEKKIIAGKITPTIASQQIFATLRKK